MNQSIDAERAVLGSILMDGDALRLVGLEPEQFSDPRHVAIFECIRSLKESSVDLVTVGEKLKSKKLLKKIGGRAYLAGLTEDVPTKNHVQEYAKIIQEAHIRREAARITKEISEGGDIDSLYDQITKLRVQSEPAHGLDVFDLVSEYEKEYQERIQRKENTGSIGIATKYEMFNDKVCMLPGQLIVLAARPSVGKSAFASNIALSVAGSGYKSLFISLEMTHHELMDRMLSEVSQVDSEKFKLATATQEERDRAYSELGKREGLTVWAPDSATTTQIYSYAAKVKEERGLDLVVVDYLGLLADKRSKSDNRDVQIGNMTRSLKIMAKQLNVCVLLLAQLNREAKDDEVELSNLRESGNIEQDANTAIAIERKKEEADGRIKILKNRSGKLGVIPIRFNSKTSTFVEKRDLAEIAQDIFNQN